MKASNLHSAKIPYDILIYPVRTKRPEDMCYLTFAEEQICPEFVVLDLRQRISGAYLKTYKIQIMDGLGNPSNLEDLIDIYANIREVSYESDTVNVEYQEKFIKDFEEKYHDLVVGTCIKRKLELEFKEWES